MAELEDGTVRSDPERVLVVDDDEPLRSLMTDILSQAGLEVVAAPDVAGAQAILAQQVVDLVVSDMRMPGGTGVDLLRWCRQAGHDTPFVMVSGYSDSALIVDALNLGAGSFVSKPFANEALLQQVEARLAVQRLARMQVLFTVHVENANRRLEQTVHERTVELKVAGEEVRTTQDVTIVALAGLAEARDPETGSHIERTRAYVRTLAQHLAANGPDGYRLSESAIDLLHRTAPLHDLGKVGTPDAILLKPGKLTVEEFEVMKKHTTYGGDALARAAGRLSTGSFLELASQIAYQHHERWDGKGYPKGLAGEAIALSARLMAIADVYDALVSKRPYKEPMTHERSREIILAGRGTQFDPIITDAFGATEKAFEEIAKRLAD
jgi:putative two-component system response regulator